MRGVLPAYASELPPVTKMSVVEHFFSPAGSFDFFCAKFPATFFACSSDKSAHRSTWTLYNYFAQRAFTLVRNPTARSISFLLADRLLSGTDGDARTDSPELPSSSATKRATWSARRRL